MKACETLRTRIDVVRKDMKDAPWKDVVAKCYEKYIDLSASFMYNVTQLKTYNTFGVSCAEVELDILTGNLLLNRVDILEDTGESLSPLVDVGQVSLHFQFNAFLNIIYFGKLGGRSFYYGHWLLAD